MPFLQTLGVSFWSHTSIMSPLIVWCIIVRQECHQLLRPITSSMLGGCGCSIMFCLKWWSLLFFVAWLPITAECFADWLSEFPVSPYIMCIDVCIAPDVVLAFYFIGFHRRSFSPRVFWSCLSSFFSVLLSS